MKGGTTGKSSGGAKTSGKSSNTTQSQSKRSPSKPAGKIDNKPERGYGQGKDDGPKKKPDPNEEPKKVVPKPNFKMKKIDTYFKGENIPNTQKNWLHGKTTVKYLNDSERAKLKVTVGKDGKLYEYKGRLFDTSQAETWDGKSKAIFIMDEKGDLYVSKVQEYGKFHHSSISA